MYRAREPRQLIKTENLFELLELEPAYVRELFISNLITRTLARILGQGPYGAVPIKCNQEGYLYVAGLGGGYDRNQTKLGTVPDAYAGPIAFERPMGRMDIVIFDKGVLFKRSRDGIVWDDEFEMFPDSMMSLDVTTLQFDVQNKTPGATARYQAVGWYTQ